MVYRRRYKKKSFRKRSFKRRSFKRRSFRRRSNDNVLNVKCINDGSIFCNALEANVGALTIMWGSAATTAFNTYTRLADNNEFVTNTARY
ncbi:MAG: hypothetical protein [Cressdnaviricota sp.]|nr:MAG: hypothetical protein [Cressdnaviricota sp.]